MIEFKRRSPATVANAEPGGDVLFLDSDGVFKTKDALGNMTVLGNGIEGITKVGASGLVDTYEIAFTSGDTFQYTVTNAKSIVELVKLGTSVLDSTYRITFNDGPAFEYVVKDGRGIANIEAPAMPGQPDTTDTYTVLYNDGTTSTFIVRNGRDGIDGLVTSVNGISQPNIVLTAADVGAIAAAEKGAPNGVATLDMAGKVPAEQLPSFVDDVLEFANLAAFPATGETGKIYVAIDTGFTYRWSGSQYVIISANQNAFAAITGNTGTATADAVSDTVSITGVNGISTTATDTPDGLVITPEYAAPVSVGTANAEGNAGSFSRSNHVHAHGDQAGGTLHAAATTTVNGFMSASDKTKLDGVQAGAQVNTVTSVFGRTGAVVAQQSDYDAFFTTPAEAAAAAPVQSVNGQTGNVTINAPALPLAAKTTNLFASTANSTAIQNVLTLDIPAGYLTAGKIFNIRLDGTQSQSAAATNVVVSIAVNGTQVVSAAVAGGTAAQTNRSIRAEGSILYNGSVFYGNVTTGISGVLPVGNANVAGVAISAASPVQITIRVQTSTANAANIIRAASAFIMEV